MFSRKEFANSSMLHILYTIRKLGSSKKFDNLLLAQNEDRYTTVQYLFVRLNIENKCPFPSLGMVRYEIHNFLTFQ